MRTEQLTFREGGPGDLATTFALSERAIYDTAARQGIVPRGGEPGPNEIQRVWRRRRHMIEFMAAQPDGRYLICENGEGPIAYARIVRFDAMEELTELMVSPDHQSKGIGRELLERCWPDRPSPSLRRLVIAAGAPRDLSLYTLFGVMPVAGHWHVVARTAEYVERRTQQTADALEPEVHALEGARAVSEWERLEADTIGHARPHLHAFFSRERTCLAAMEPGGERASGLCWVGSDADVGPAVAAKRDALVPVVLAALDRVARTHQPEQLSLFVTTEAWRLLTRLRRLGFRVHWPSWILSSTPLPGLDRYLPTRPPNLL